MQVSLENISKALGLCVEAIRKRAVKESWPYREIIDRKVGRNKNVFLVEDLPVDIRVKVLQALNSDYQKNQILPQRNDMGVPELKALLDKWNKAPGWQKKIAEARLDIITGLNDYENRCKGRNRKKHLQRFSNEFDIRSNKIGLSLETFDIIKKISRSTLYNYEKEFKNYGLVGLLPRGKGKPSAVWNPDMQSFMEGLIARNPDIRVARVCDYLKNHFAGPKIIIPSRKTVWRKVQQYKSVNNSAYALLKNPDKWRNEYQLALGDAAAKAKYFLHMIEFDSSPADILCSDGHRHAVIGAIDQFSRKAKIIVSPTSKSTAIKSLVRNINLDWGVFDVMITDQGADYTSSDIMVVSHGLGIDLRPTLHFSPEKKPHIERFFGSLSVGLFEELSGYIGHSVAGRKAIESRKSFAQRFGKRDEVIEIGLSSVGLQELCDKWIENIYHQRIHRSLGKSPEAKAAESTRPVRKIDPRLLDLLLAPAGFPTVQKKGIQFQGAFYIAPELGDFVKKKVEIRRDLLDAGRVYVFDLSRKFICVAEDASISGLTVAEINEARNSQKKKVQEQVRAMRALGNRVGDPMADLLESKSRAPGQIHAFHRTEEATGGMIAEAQKALRAQDEGTEAISGLEPDAKETSKIVQISNKRPSFFTSFLERYKYIKSQENIRELTPREIEFKGEYEGTEEYWLIYAYEKEGKTV